MKTMNQYNHIRTKKGNNRLIGIAKLFMCRPNTGDFILEEGQ